jgi:hypothetical protein
MTLSIPLPTSDQPFTTQSTSLEGRSYKVTLNWNSRTDRWSMSMATEDGDSIITGAALAIGIDLLRTVPGTLDIVPPGELFLAGTDDPTLATISTVSMIYVPSE